MVIAQKNILGGKVETKYKHQDRIPGLEVEE